MRERFSKFGTAMAIHVILFLGVAIAARLTDANVLLYHATEKYRYFIVCYLTTVVAGIVFENKLLGYFEEGTHRDFQTRFFVPILTTAIYTGLTMPNYNIIGVLFGPISLQKGLTILYALGYIAVTNALCAWKQVAFEIKEESIGASFKAYLWGLGFTVAAIIIVNIIAVKQPWYSPLYFEDRDIVKYYANTMAWLYFIPLICKAIAEEKICEFDSFRTPYSDVTVAAITCIFFTQNTCGTNKNIFGLFNHLDNLSAAWWFILSYAIIAAVGLFVRLRYDSRDAISAASARQRIQQSAGGQENLPMTMNG